MKVADCARCKLRLKGALIPNPENNSGACVQLSKWPSTNVRACASHNNEHKATPKLRAVGECYGALCMKRSGTSYEPRLLHEADHLRKNSELGT